MSQTARRLVLLTGGSGQVGTALQRLPSTYEIAAPSRHELDLSDPEQIADLVKSRPWDLVISSGAYTAVDKAQTDAVAAWRINALGPAALATETARADIPIIHLSTDYVFDGTKLSPYVEDDPVGPVSVYGASKEGGEQAVRTLNPQHVILRTAWVVSATGSNFVKTMLRLGETRDELSVVDDQLGCPTSAADIATALWTIADHILGAGPERFGTYHLVNSGEATWRQLADHVFSRAAQAGRKVPIVSGIPSSQYPTPVQRPMNSRLDTAKLTRAFGVTPRPWLQAIDQVMDDLLSSRRT
jgi:dTDP-4-dehydrorhamnose reductase